MKKRYEKPEICIVDMISCPMFATSCNIDKQSQGDFSVDFVRERRGAWGNLWKEDDIKENI